MLVFRCLEESAARTPAAAALIEPGRSTTYRELDELANRFARLFLTHGVNRGDRIVVALDNGASMVAAYFGAMKAGGVAVPLPAGPRSDRFAHAVADCRPRIAIVEEAAARAPHISDALSQVPAVFVDAAASNAAAHQDLAQALDSCSADPVAVRSIDLDLAAIIYTSGSTGEPRGVMLTHRNFVANARSIVSYLQLSSTDRVLCVLPFYYVYGLSLLHTHMMVGGSVVIEPRSAFPNVVLGAMQEHAVTGFAGVPSTFNLLLHRSNLDEVSLPQLRYVTQAGGGMAPDRINEWLARGPKAAFFVMYGATEAAARLTYLPPADLPRKLGSIGRPIPNVEIVVMNEAGAAAQPGEAGELVARGSNIACGYWNNPRETAERFASGGYRTGDIGYFDEDGYLFLVGRQHDMIKVGAHRVGAKEIEEVLQSHASVLDAAVVAAPHDVLGEVPVAFVSLRASVDDVQSALKRHCASLLPPHKVPARVTHLSELPKLAGAGKIDRLSLRKMAAESIIEATR